MLNAALLTLLEILLQQFSQVNLLFICATILEEGKAVILLCTKSQLQCWNCQNLLKMWMLNLKCSGPNTQHFCKTSALMHAQHISKSDLALKLHTESYGMHDDSLPGRRAVLQDVSGRNQHRSTRVFLLASSASSTARPFSDGRGNAGALYTFLPTFSVSSSGTSHPRHWTSKRPKEKESMITHRQVAK